MIGQLRLTLVQSDLAWQDADANRSLLAGQLAPLAGQSDLIVLPEMFTSDFVTGQGAVAEPWPGPTLTWMLDQAAGLDAALCGSIAVEEQGKRLNRLLFVTPEGQVQHYDKRHLFRMLGEHERYAAGRDKLIVEYRGWRILPLVCYDLRFPVWCRSSRQCAWDLMLVVANWPAARTVHWRSLLQARAIENLAWTVGVNRVGRDGNGLDYDGCSMVVDPQGNEVLQAGNRAGVFHANISMTAVQEWRSRFPAWMDADHFSLEQD